MFRSFVVGTLCTVKTSKILNLQGSAEESRVISIDRPRNGLRLLIKLVEKKKSKYSSEYVLQCFSRVNGRYISIVCGFIVIQFVESSLKKCTKSLQIRVYNHFKIRV